MCEVCHGVRPSDDGERAYKGTSSKVYRKLAPFKGREIPTCIKVGARSTYRFASSLPTSPPYLPLIFLHIGCVCLLTFSFSKCSQFHHLLFVGAGSTPDSELPSLPPASASGSGLPESVIINTEINNIDIAAILSSSYGHAFLHDFLMRRPAGLYACIHSLDPQGGDVCMYACS